jgi:uncharacterized membrane protein YeaQ/YmgE (transglycosylase-associated protein family)
MVGILSWLGMGLVVGAMAKWIMPGRDPGGLVSTIIIGIVGAMIGGWLGTLLGIGRVDGFNLGSIVIATGGGVVLLWILRKLKG